MRIMSNYGQAVDASDDAARGDVETWNLTVSAVHRQGRGVDNKSFQIKQLRKHIFEDVEQIDH